MSLGSAVFSLSFKVAVTLLLVLSAFVFRELAPVFMGLLLFFIVLWVITPFKVPKGRPLIGKEALVGSEGEALSDVHEEGKVRVAGEIWSATSEVPIREGERVRVEAVHGIVLNVRKAAM